MTKKELVAYVAKDSGLTQSNINMVFESFLSHITKAVAGEDGKIMLPGFGTFEKVYRSARKCRNPRTGEAMDVKAKNSVKFKPAKNFKKIVAG